ncbi:dynein axonemal assembly factor 1 [Pycnococcus provasolii]
MEISKEYVRVHCQQNGGYRQPALNDKLYLHYKGITDIGDALEEYTNLKALFLESNGIDTFDGIRHLANLKCLFLQQNAFTDMDGCEGLEQLTTLNLTSNQICEVDGIAGNCPQLETLQLAKNKLTTLKSIEHLAECASLNTLDLSDNQLENGEEVIALLSKLPELRVLYLKGNPLVRVTRHYRKTVIASIPTLTYLDERPVFPNERRTSDAWMAAGGVAGGEVALEAEREMRRTIQEEKRIEEQRNFEHLKEWRAKAFAGRERMESTRAALERMEKRRAAIEAEEEVFEDDDLDEYLSGSDDEEWKPLEEPPELIRAREKLARYSARPGEEEPEELTEARRRLAKQGLGVQQAHWSAADPGEVVQAARASTGVNDGDDDDDDYMPPLEVVTPGDTPRDTPTPSLQ